MTLFEAARNEVASLTGRKRLVGLYMRFKEFLEEREEEMTELAGTFCDESVEDPQEQADRLFLLTLVSFNAEDDRKVEMYVTRAKEILFRMGEDDQAYVMNDIMVGIHTDAQEYKTVIPYALESLRNYEKLNDEYRLAQVLNNLGISYSSLNRFSDALPVLNRGLALNLKNNEPDIVNSYNNIASLYLRVRLYNKALATYKLALEACEKFGLEAMEYIVLNNIANINTDLENYSEALQYYRQALQKCGNDYRNMAITINNIGMVFYFQEKYSDAIENFEKSLKICQEKRFSYTEAKNLYNIGHTHTKMNRFDEARTLLLEARPMVENTGDLRLLADVDIALAELNTATKRYDEALAILEDVYRRPHDEYKDVVNVDKAFIMLYRETDDIEKLAFYQSKLLEKYEQRHEKDFTQLVAEMQVALDLELKEKEAEMQRQKALELQKKNQEILEQKHKLERTLEELHKSEISYEFLQKEYKDQLGSMIIGESEPMRRLHSLISMVAAANDTSVLITGETGTGKELVARAIHELSSRKRRTFCAVNASSIPETLFESEFFGYRKNAFTGADRDKAGWFEIANEGTLFLDEVGTWRYDIQSKFLRVLESRKIVPVGGDREISVDFRLISATNDDLQCMIQDNGFRADLYYRLSSFIINIPPLRERIEDIPPLLEHYVNYFNQRMNKKITRIEKQVEDALSQYTFPGNVRELKNMIEHAMIISNTSTLRLSSFSIPQQQAFDDIVIPLDEHEKSMILKALKQTKYHQSNAAELLGLTPKSMERRMKKYNIVKPKRR